VGRDKPEGKKTLTTDLHWKIILNGTEQNRKERRALDSSNSGYGKWQAVVNRVMNIRAP